jgi:hypothetical protein
MIFEGIKLSIFNLATRANRLGTAPYAQFTDITNQVAK